MDLPTDPLILFLGLMFGLKFLGDQATDQNWIKHPLSVAIMLHLGWLLITAAASSMPSVSFKFFASRFLYILIFYWAAYHVFRRTENMHRFLWLYMIPLTFVVIYTFQRHLGYNLDQRVSYGMSQPFYVNHGIYAAALAMFIPILFIFVLKGDYLGYGNWGRFWSGVLLLIFLVGIVYSFTRAAWISLVGAGILSFLALVKLKPRTYFLGFLLLCYGMVQIQEKIEEAVRKNQQVSADSFDKHLKSIYNIKNDDSNLERINRWKSALRMTADRPLTGFGAGTYVFQYAPFQRSTEITKISTNFGTLGNAHSEFLQPLAETGIPGGLIFLAIVVLMMVTAFNLTRQGNAEEKFWGLGIGLGLATYFIHGLLNNYSDLDKSGVLIWGFAAMLAALDVKRRQRISHP